MRVALVGAGIATAIACRQRGMEVAVYEAARKPRVTRIQDMSRFEVNFKKQSTLRDRLRREWMYLPRFGTLTPGVHRWIYGYDPRSAWRGG